MFRLTVTFINDGKPSQQHFNFDSLHAAYAKANDLLGHKRMYKMELYVLVETWNKLAARES